MEESKINKMQNTFSSSKNLQNEETGFKIKKLEEETKKLLDKFSKALDKVKSEEEWNVERDEDRRKEGEGQACDNTFREIMLENAPRHDSDFIIAEKKSW